MTSHRWIAALLLPLLLVLPFVAGTSRAQTTNADPRFQFSDTTLVRDTLGLTFERLFPIADSLRMTPDTLRALSVRYRWTLARLVKLSDSLSVPVDSVGPIMERERFNVLANVGAINSFQYFTNYAVGQYNQAWTNRVDYRVSRGKAFLNNSTNIGINKNQRGATTQDRSATTEVSWRRSKDLSIGMNSDLTRFDSFDDRGSIYNQKGSTTNLSLAIRSTQRAFEGVSSHVNFLGGFYSSSGTEDKNGARGDLNGDLRMTRGRWLNVTTSGQLAANVVRLAVPFTQDDLPGPDPVGTHDQTANARGTLNLFQSYPVAMVANFRVATTSIAKPGAMDTVVTGDGTLKQVTNVESSRTSNSNLDATLRLRKDNDRSLDILGQAGTTSQPSSSAIRAPVTSDTRKAGLSGRYLLGPIRLDGSFSLSDRSNVNPNGDGRGGRRIENVDSRSLDGSMEWVMSTRISTRLRGSVTLDKYRYETSPNFVSPVEPRDRYYQSYEINTQYRRSQRASTTLGLQVSDAQEFHLLTGSVASSTDARSYRATWQWSYLLVTGLTATQTNQMSANYQFQPYAPSSNRLALDYSTATQLNAVFSPRFNQQLNHNARFGQTGSYRVYSPSALEYYSQSDEDQNYGLNARVTYAFSPALSVEFRPEYTASGRDALINGALGPDRRTKNLNLTGATNLNIDVGKRGKLTGTLGRHFHDDRTIQYTNGVPKPRPRSETLNWDGSLQFSWTL